MAKILFTLFTTLLFIAYSLFGFSDSDKSSKNQRLIAKENPTAPNTAYINGLWLDEKMSFRQRTLYSVNGIFTTTKPGRIDTVINLQNTYVVPPFGDAHNHAFADTRSMKFSKRVYLERGFFYSLNLTNLYTEAKKLKETTEQPATIDVAYSHGGITALNNNRPHPAALMERVYGSMAEDTSKEWPLEGNAYWFMNSKKLVQEKWQQLMSQDPDVIKVYIMQSNSTTTSSNSCGVGLCPDILQTITDSAHANGKRVFAHVNTAHDFQLALDSNVDAIAHFPIINRSLSINRALSSYALADSTIEQAGKMNVTLIPTASLLNRNFSTAATSELTDIIKLQRDQMRKLKNAGVTLALGADGYEGNPQIESMYMDTYDFFSDSELLELLSYNTPKTIFPNRKIASFADGFEASFVALECDPTSEFSCIKNIKTLVKNGAMITVD